jgi:deoxyhypusine synthase
MQGDYSMVVPFLIKALLDRRAKFERLRDELGEATLFERHPEARGYLRSREGYRLFDQREALVGKLREAVRENAAWLEDTLTYPLANPTK